MKSISKAAVVRVYRWYAPFYDLLFGRVLESGRIELAKAVADRSPQRLLEVGVGTGLALLHRPPGVLACGVDISMDMLRRAQSAVNSQRLGNAALLCADAELLPFADASFDCVTLPYVLSVTPYPERLLAELHRVCTPGGQILVVNHFKGAGVWQVAERLMAPLANRIGFRSTMSMDTLESPQWQIVSVRNVNLFGLSKLVELRNGCE
jgi:phosphatidylethanolamine/phosphatidyl-N-methylethanolamine N-methyltransferase